MSRMTRAIPPLCLAVLGAGLGHGALAHQGVMPASDQPAAGSAAASVGSLAEIVVTATRRAQTLQSVPISIQVFTRAEMDKASVRNITDLARDTPGVTFSNTDRGNTQGSNIVIRGISSGAGTATVGVYLNDTPIQIRPDSVSSSNAYPVIFDLQRIEVLRGPQGTLFGAGSEGGTIRFITPQPSLSHYHVYARSELASIYHGDDSYDAGLAVGGPIVRHVLGFRASAYYQRTGGYVNRVNWFSGRLEQQNANWNDVTALQLATKWVPLRHLSIEPSVFYQRTHIADSSIYWESFSNPADSVFNNGNPVLAPTDDSFTLPALRVSWQGRTVSVFSNTSYFNRNNDNIYDSTTLDMASFAGISSPVPPASLQNVYSTGLLTDNQRVFTEEVRVQNSNAHDRFDWLAGVFYQRSRQANTYDVIDPFVNQILGYAMGPALFSQVFPNGFPLYRNTYLLYSQGQLTDRELAGFVNFDYRILPKLTLTAGVRVSNENYQDTTFGAGPVLGGVATTSVQTQSATPVTPKYALEYRFSADHMVYASAAKGFRQGSTAAQVPVPRCSADLAALGLQRLGQGPSQIKPDSVWSYEVGSKDRFFDGRLAVDASLYRINWNDIQSSFFLPTCNVPVSTNLGNAVSQGFDLNLFFAPLDNLTAGLAIGYDDAHYTSTTTGASGVPIQEAGQPLPFAAPWTVSPTVDYDFGVLGHRAYFHVDYQYVGNNSTPLPHLPSVDPTIPRPPSSSNLDMRLGMHLGDMDLSIFGTNINNQHPEFGRYRDTEAPISNYRGYTVAPRTIGVTATYRY